MILSWGRLLVLPAALVSLMLVSQGAQAAPFVVGSTTCGTLNKTRDANTGKVVWKVVGCTPLDNLIGQQSGSCGNGQIDTGEVCDTGDPFTCNGAGPASCTNNCTTCSGVVITPTPTGTRPTPTPPPGDCNKGNVPLYNKPGFEDWYGMDNVGIDPGATDTWCFPVNSTTCSGGPCTRLVMNVGDNTGAAQCFSHTADYIPPANSGWSDVLYDRFVTNSGNTFLSFGAPLPQGVWRIRITAADNTDCNMKYQIKVHP